MESLESKPLELQLNDDELSLRKTEKKQVVSGGAPETSSQRKSVDMHEPLQSIVELNYEASSDEELLQNDNNV